MDKKHLYLPTHEITPQTMAVLPRLDKYGNPGSYIIEEQEEYYVNSAPSKVIDQACKFFGSSLKGRQEGTRAISELTHKAPISIDPASGMYFFPTTSPTNPKCSWIAHTHISKMYEAPNRCTKVVFKNGKSIILEVSLGSMENQVNRTAQFRYILENRIQSIMNQKNSTFFK